MYYATVLCGHHHHHLFHSIMAKSAIYRVTGGSGAVDGRVACRRDGIVDVRTVSPWRRQ